MASPRKPSAKFYVYRITNEVNGKSYIGKTGKPRYRWNIHKWMARTNKKGFLYDAMRKHGVENFAFKLLASYASEEDAFIEEMRLIKKYKTFGAKGYNMTAGGEGVPGQVFTPERRAKMSKALRGRKLSDEQCKAIGDRSRGRKASKKAIRNMKLGWIKRLKTPVSPEALAETNAKRVATRAWYKHSEETRAKMSASQQGKKVSKEARRNMSAAHEGVPLSEAHRKALGAAQKAAWASKDRKQITGRQRALVNAKISAAQKGKKRSPEAIEAVRLGGLRRWAAIRMDNHPSNISDTMRLASA